MNNESFEYLLVLITDFKLIIFFSKLNSNMNTVAKVINLGK